jgi:hypothetical protein
MGLHLYYGLWPRLFFFFNHLPQFFLDRSGYYLFSCRHAVHEKRRKKKEESTANRRINKQNHKDKDKRDFASFVSSPLPTLLASVAFLQKTSPTDKITIGHAASHSLSLIDKTVDEVQSVEKQTRALP